MTFIILYNQFIYRIYCLPKLFDKESNKKGNIHLRLVCEMLLIGFQKGIPLHIIHSWLCQLDSVLTNLCLS